MRQLLGHLFVVVTGIVSISIAIAADNPGETRSELMQDVRDAAKPVGGMLRGKVDFDAAVVADSLAVWAAAADQFGGLFPAGSEGGEAAPAIWDDRDGFDAALVEWQDAIAAAQAAAPADLDAAKPVLGAVFGSCKNCHDSYRIEKD